MTEDGVAETWRHFANPAAQWDALPSFMFGEVLFISLAILALVHARHRGRSHLLIWLAALIAGTANDFIFMALPLVDNFWQAQATVMLTPRMPLYIPCVYLCFMYYPTVAVRRLGLRGLALAALTGLTACLFYAPYDIIGAKFLWWTWHDTDQPTAARVLGAPVASSLWVLTFVGAFSWLVDHTLRDRSEISGAVFARGFAKVAGLTTLMMMVQMTVLQQIDGGTPGYGALAAGIGLYAALVWRGRADVSARPIDGMDRVIRAAVVLYFAALVGIGATFSPSAHVSTGLHQPVGECYVEAKDITGLTRHVYLCAADFEEDFTFDCVDGVPEDGALWYTVCGRPHRDFPRWMGGLAGLGLGGGALFLFLLGAGRKLQ